MQSGGAAVLQVTSADRETFRKTAGGRMKKKENTHSDGELVWRLRLLMSSIRSQKMKICRTGTSFFSPTAADGKKLSCWN